VARWVLHLDLDQFIAAVEVLRHPELRGRPVVVGGRGDVRERAVVSTASYEARESGVRSGMPLRVAARRLAGRSAVFLPVDKDAYEAASASVMATVKEFDAVVEVIGWDEAFIGAATEQPHDLAARIAGRVLEVTGLHCSIGIGQNKLQAKTATGFAKPAGIHRITSATWFDVMGDRPTEELYGIGSRTAAKLAELGIVTVRQLAEADDAQLAARFGPTIGPWLGTRGRGRDPSPVVGDPHIPRSRSRETTFQTNLDDWDDVRAELAALARLVATDIADDGRPIVRVGVKVRWAPFTTQTRVRTLPAPTTDAEQLAEAALRVLDAFRPAERRSVRLLGVRAEFAGR
jgi:nucleotidyltransferase/DNA polymerase involved in DNA repair